MKSILVSLVSDQTIPNVQLIKEFSESIDGYLFISTEAMEKRGVRESIIRACNIPAEKILDEIIVGQFSFADIEAKLDERNFEEFEKVLVNLTGGTKVMTLAAFDYFKTVGAEIYYLTGQDDELIKVSPGRTKKIEKIKSKVNLKEYLESYGFVLSETSPSGISEEYTNKLFNIYTKGLLNDFQDVLNQLREVGRKKKHTIISEVDNLSDMLKRIEFPLIDPNKQKISKYEVKFITGEWLEEYLGRRIKEELKLSDDHIKTGLQITKSNKQGNAVPNEMDILFVYNNKIYVIECKTSVFHDEVQPDGEFKKKSIIGETLYKSDSLKQGLGLFANTFLFILDNINENSQKLKSHLERAELYNIKVIDKEKIQAAQNISTLLGIQ